MDQTEGGDAAARVRIGVDERSRSGRHVDTDLLNIGPEEKLPKCHLIDISYIVLLVNINYSSQARSAARTLLQR